MAFNRHGQGLASHVPRYTGHWRLPATDDAPYRRMAPARCTKTRIAACGQIAGILQRPTGPRIRWVPGLCPARARAVPDRHPTHTPARSHVRPALPNAPTGQPDAPARAPPPHRCGRRRSARRRAAAVASAAAASRPGRAADGRRAAGGPVRPPAGGLADAGAALRRRHGAGARLAALAGRATQPGHLQPAGIAVGRTGAGAGLGRWRR